MSRRPGVPDPHLRLENREQAGRELARELRAYAGREDVLILALPRGGVPVAYEVARGLAAPLAVFVVRKLGVPGQEELAMGAIASGGVVVVNEELVHEIGISREELSDVIDRERRELERRERLYRGDRPGPAVEGRVVILVDDGLATGATMRAAVAALRRQSPARIVVAAPVGAGDTCRRMRAEADEVICARTPEPFLAVGLWYREFDQTTDEQVRDLLERARAALGDSAQPCDLRPERT